VALGSGGCQIGDKIFSNFSVTNASAWANVTPLNPDEHHMGFQFGGAFASTGALFVASLSYDVTVIGGANRIHDMLLSVGGVGTIPPGVVFSIGEDVLDSSGIGANLLASLEVGNFGQPLTLFDSATWLPVNFIHVNKDITIFPFDNQGGTVAFNFSEVTQIVSQVPEPMTMSLMGAGLLALGVLGRRRRRQ
jgi:hypothetical protein